MGAGTVTGTVTLSAAAPTGGATVTLASSSSAVTVPASIVIAAGSTSTTFAVTTVATTTVSATNVATGGVPVTATATLSAAAPDGGASISLFSSSSLVSVPANAIVSKGATSTTFTVGTSPAATSATATITASYGGVAQTATLTIGTVALFLGGSTPVPGGVTVTATITLPAPAPDGGAVVALASNASDVVMPSSVTVPAAMTMATFPVSTLDAPPTETATITATYGGTTQSATLTVLAFPVLSSVQCTPSTPSGGVTAKCQSTVSPPSSAGWTLLLGSDSSAASVPATGTISPGSTLVQFDIATTAVSTQTIATIQVYDAPTGLVVWRMLITINP